MTGKYVSLSVHIREQFGSLFPRNAKIRRETKRDRQTDRERQRETETERDRQRDRDRDRQTDRQTERDRETERERDGFSHTNLVYYLTRSYKSKLGNRNYIRLVTVRRRDGFTFDKSRGVVSATLRC